MRDASVRKSFSRRGLTRCIKNAILKFRSIVARVRAPRTTSSRRSRARIVLRLAAVQGYIYKTATPAALLEDKVNPPRNISSLAFLYTILSPTARAGCLGNIPRAGKALSLSLSSFYFIYPVCAPVPESSQQVSLYSLSLSRVLFYFLFRARCFQFQLLFLIVRAHTRRREERVAIYIYMRKVCMELAALFIRLRARSMLFSEMYLVDWRDGEEKEIKNESACLLYVYNILVRESRAR